MHTVSEIVELLEGLNCADCGATNCRSLARKLAAGDKSIDDCKIIPEDKAKLIDAILKEGVDIGAKSVIHTEEGITYIHPCTESNKVAADTQLKAGPEGEVDLKYGFFDPWVMCYGLKSAGFFEDLKCSTEMGIAKFNYEGKNIIVFKDGRINIRKAENQEDLLAILRLVARVLWGAVICSCCGSSAIDCASGSCNDCATRVCPVLAGGPPGTESKEFGKTEGGTTFVRIEKLSAGYLFKEGIENLNNIFNKLGNIPQEDIDKLIEDTQRKGLQFVLKTENTFDAVLGLVLSGLSNDVRAIAESLNAFEDKENELYLQTKQLTIDAYTAFKESDLEKAKDIFPRFGKLRKQIRDAGNDKYLATASQNATFIARLLPKPLPEKLIENSN